MNDERDFSASRIVWNDAGRGLRWRQRCGYTSLARAPSGYQRNLDVHATPSGDIFRRAERYRSTGRFGGLRLMRSMIGFVSASVAMTAMPM